MCVYVSMYGFVCVYVCVCVCMCLYVCECVIAEGEKRWEYFEIIIYCVYAFVHMYVSP